MGSYLLRRPPMSLFGLVRSLQDGSGLFLGASMYIYAFHTEDTRTRDVEIPQTHIDSKVEADFKTPIICFR